MKKPRMVLAIATGWIIVGQLKSVSLNAPVRTREGRLKIAKKPKGVGAKEAANEQ
jgi:hypothetical protein